MISHHVRRVRRIQAAALASVMAVMTPADSAIASPSSRDTPDEKTLVMTMSRSTCFGTCPDYNVSLYEDGTLEYEGRRFVKVTGSRKKTLDSATVQRVRQAIVDSGIQQLEPDCCGCQEWTDSPTVVISMMTDGQRKTVYHYHGCTKAPDWLGKLEDRLDSLLGTDEFVGTLEQRRQGKIVR
jgi:hypothetical protein